MKTRQVAFSLVLLGLLFLTASCNNQYAEPVEYVQPQVEQAVGVGVEQIAIFYKTNDEYGLQQAVNAWLNQNNGRVEIVRVLQTASGRIDRTLTISIFYKKTK